MNSHNRIPVSVRIAQEDADFIAALQIEGAHTPSEKIRELLSRARLAHTQAHDYGAALEQMEQFFHNAKHDVLHAEKNLGIHSHIIARLFELLPDLAAALAQDLPADADADTLKQYEREAMWRVVRLTDSILQLAVTGKGAAYDDSVLNNLDNTLQLAAIIRQTRQP
ncbi:hypothetical protein L1281_001830 [Neisseria sp. HSC-16F19]|nr:hypothetical protein [Neisseria sp. HSC-16F19]MCP2041236.1 hypothetical protein [Neisseria sp. HSC-16F19]